jgi:hypothetical protein
MAYIPPTTHVTLFALLRRDRFLPQPGEVLVREGQRVEATEVVARAGIATEHRLLDIAHDLGVPSDKADQFLVKDSGEVVKKGEPLAVRKLALGLYPKRVPSPVDGQLVVAGEGKALLAVMPQAFELRAGFPGVVARVVERWGISIEVSGALLEGVWSNAAPSRRFPVEDFGVMRVVGSGPAEALDPEQVDVSLRGTLIAAGVLDSDALLKKLADVHVRGLILGSLAADLIPVLQKLDLPVVVTDGFGKQGFSPAAYALLVSNSGREAWISAVPRDRFAGRRPEVIIPLPSPGQSPPGLVAGEALNVDKRVRIVRGPEAGRAGKVASLGERTTLLPSGVRARVATVEFDQTHEPAVQAPFANLEIIE